MKCWEVGKSVSFLSGSVADMSYTPARQSLSRRISLSLGLLCTAIVLVVSALVFVVLSWRVGDRMQAQAENTIAFLAQALETPFWGLDKESAMAVAQATAMDRSVGLLELRDIRGETWFEHKTGNALFIIREVEVRHEGQTIGVIKLGLEESFRTRAVTNIGIAGGGIVLIVILAQYFLATWLLRRYFQRPFRDLDALVGAYAQGNYHPVNPGTQYTEFEPLVHAFLAMGRTIERQMSALRENEEKYRAIFDNSPVGIFRTTIDGLLVEGNPSLGRMFGYENRDDFFSANGFRVDTTYADQASRQNLVQALLASTSAASREIEFVRKDGTRFEGLLTASIQHDETGRPAFLNGVVEDVSARKLVEKRLRQSEEKFSRLFRLSPDVIILMSLAEGRIIDVNDAFSRLTGYAHADAVGKTASELGLYDSLTAREAVRDLVREFGMIENFEFLLRRKDGSVIECVLSCQMLRIDQEDCVMAVLRDVTEFKHMQEMMIQTEKMISVGGIAAGVAHEINNPLGIIVVTSQNLVQRTKPDFPKNLEVARSIGLDMELLDKYMQARGLHVFIKNIQDAAVRAADIIRHMLDFSRRSESKREICEMRGIIDRAIHLAESDYDLMRNYDFKKIRIVWEGDERLPLVNCTETEIEQVFLNLLRNAAQAIASSRQEIADPRITIRTSRKEDHVVVEVEDNGPGMPPEVQRRAFEPFFTTKPPGVGTGLGLSVSYFIVTRSHDGRMRLESRPGQGTKFIIELPASGAMRVEEE